MESTKYTLEIRANDPVTHDEIIRALMTLRGIEVDLVEHVELEMPRGKKRFSQAQTQERLGRLTLTVTHNLNDLGFSISQIAEVMDGTESQVARTLKLKKPRPRHQGES